MAFNFGQIATTQATATVSRTLKPWAIYPVKFAGCRVDHIQGKKDPSQTYDILKIRFENEEGYYEESIFFPREGDDERPTYQNREGHDYQTPSRFEQTMAIIAQLGTVLNREGFEKMQAASSKFRNFEDVCKALIAITDPVKGKETNIKLIGRNRDGRVSAALPRICGVNKQGELFTSDNFIGDKLFFTTYEENQISAYQNAKPTDMSKTESNPSDLLNPTSDDSDDSDVTLLLEGLGADL